MALAIRVMKTLTLTLVVPGVLAVLSLCFACAPKAVPTPTEGATPRVVPLAEAPEDWQDEIARADEALTLMARATMEGVKVWMDKEGPHGAIPVCHEVVTPLTQAAAADGIELGRTSHRLRNPKNAPRAWVAPFLEKPPAKAEAFVPVAVDLGDRMGVLKPISVGAQCVACHGPEGELSGEVFDALKAAYPEDQAKGFNPGDFRGLFWAEVPRR